MYVATSLSLLFIHLLNFVTAFIHSICLHIFRLLSICYIHPPDLSSLQSVFTPLFLPFDSVLSFLSTPSCLPSLLPHLPSASRLFCLPSLLPPLPSASPFLLASLPLSDLRKIRLSFVGFLDNGCRSHVLETDSGVFQVVWLAGRSVLWLRAPSSLSED